VVWRPFPRMPDMPPSRAWSTRGSGCGFLAFLIDNAVMGIGFVLILIPLIFLTGLGGFISEIHPDEDMNDVGIFMLIGLLFLAATVSLLLTWLYHALMESSEWQATLGKRVLGLVVTDMAGRRVSFGRATGRHFAKIITNMVPAFIGYIMAGFTERKQGAARHDRGMPGGCGETIEEEVWKHRLDRRPRLGYATTGAKSKPEKIGRLDSPGHRN